MQAMTIPRKAVIERGQLTSVYVVDQAGIARTRLVQTGKPYSDRVEVLSSLREGEQIVVDGVAAVNDGGRYEKPVQVCRQRRNSRGAKVTRDGLGPAGKLARAFIDSKLTPLVIVGVDPVGHRRGVVAPTRRRAADRCADDRRLCADAGRIGKGS